MDYFDFESTSKLKPPVSGLGKLCIKNNAPFNRFKIGLKQSQKQSLNQSMQGKIHLYATNDKKRKKENRSQMKIDTVVELKCTHTQASYQRIRTSHTHIHSIQYTVHKVHKYRTHNDYADDK